MKASFSLSLFLLIALTFGQTPQKNKITLNLSVPRETETIEVTDKPLYLFGTVSPSDSKININGSDAAVDEDGAFLAYAPVIVLDEKNNKGLNKGKFVIKVSAGNEHTTLEKFVWLKMPPATQPAGLLSIDTLWAIKPERNMSLLNGEMLNVEIKATPGCRVYFNIEGISGEFPMPEKEVPLPYYWGEIVFGSGFINKPARVSGVYQGFALVSQAIKDAAIIITIEHPQLGKMTVHAPGRLSTIDSQLHEVVKVKHDPNLAVGRFGPQAGYKLFMPEGINLEVIGKDGNWLKTKLSNEESAYLPLQSVEFLPLGTPPSKTDIQIIRTKDLDRQVAVEFGFSSRVPYSITQYDNPERIEILTYNVTSSIDWVYYDRKSDFIKEIKHSQTSDGVLRTEVFLNQKTHWGYNAYYDNNVLTVKINKPAKRNSSFLFWDNQLEGRIISIDPGHTAESGAIGPRGTKEKDVNYAISVKLKEMLEDAGATVYMTHAKDADLPLRERKARVNSFNPEISVSIHNNAVPQSVNPLVHNGSSVYYYYPQALPLAKIIHRNFIKNLELNDFGLYWDNLYMARIPESISLLVEPAFMIVPEQERLLRTEDFQELIAESIFDALETFYKEYSQ